MALVIVKPETVVACHRKEPEVVVRTSPTIATTKGAEQTAVTRATTPQHPPQACDRRRRTNAASRLQIPEPRAAMNRNTKQKSAASSPSF
jgi:hypothetical protein